MPKIETIAIKANNAKGKKIINKSDFDPKKHKEYVAPVEKTEEELEAEAKAKAAKK